jgi:hypothetical protein
MHSRHRTGIARRAFLYSATEVIMHWKAENYFGKTHQTAVHLRLMHVQCIQRNPYWFLQRGPVTYSVFISLAPSESDADVSLTP